VRKILGILLAIVLTCGASQEAIAAATQGAARTNRYSYDGVGSPDVVEARRVATALGVGKTVDVTTIKSKRLRAKIQSVDGVGFTVTHGRSPAPVVIAYDEVTQLRPAGLRRACEP